MAPRQQASKAASKMPETKIDTKKGRAKKEYAPVSLSQLKPVKLTPKDKVTVIPGRERSEEQKAVDATVKDIAIEYLDAGSPKDFRDMPVVSYTLPPDQAATVRFMIGKACNLLNCKPKFGRQAWDDGNEVVSFCAIPREPSQWTDKTDEKPEEPVEKPEEKKSEPAAPSPTVQRDFT
jgi:hypothetical protein